MLHFFILSFHLLFYVFIEELRVDFREIGQQVCHKKIQGSHKSGNCQGILQTWKSEGKVREFEMWSWKFFMTSYLSRLADDFCM